MKNNFWCKLFGHKWRETEYPVGPFCVPLEMCSRCKQGRAFCIFGWVFFPADIVRKFLFAKEHETTTIKGDIVTLPAARA